MTTTIEQHWARYVQQVMPKDPGHLQIQETRRAFYAACHVMLVSMRDEITALPDFQAIRVLQALHDECQAFARAIERGEA